MARSKKSIKRAGRRSGRRSTSRSGRRNVRKSRGRRSGRRYRNRSYRGEEKPRPNPLAAYFVLSGNSVFDNNKPPPPKPTRLIPPPPPPPPDPTRIQRAIRRRLAQRRAAAARANDRAAATIAAAWRARAGRVGGGGGPVVRQFNYDALAALGAEANAIDMFGAVGSTTEPAAPNPGATLSERLYQGILQYASTVAAEDLTEAPVSQQLRDLAAASSPANTTAHYIKFGAYTNGIPDMVIPVFGGVQQCSGTEVQCKSQYTIRNIIEDLRTKLQDDGGIRLRAARGPPDPRFAPLFRFMRYLVDNEAMRFRYLVTLVLATKQGLVAGQMNSSVHSMPDNAMFMMHASVFSIDNREDSRFIQLLRQEVDKALRVGAIGSLYTDLAAACHEVYRDPDGTVASELRDDTGDLPANLYNFRIIHAHLMRNATFRKFRNDGLTYPNGDLIGPFVPGPDDLGSDGTRRVREVFPDTLAGRVNPHVDYTNHMQGLCLEFVTGIKGQNFKNKKLLDYEFLGSDPNETWGLDATGVAGTVANSWSLQMPKQNSQNSIWARLILSVQLFLTAYSAYCNRMGLGLGGSTPMGLGQYLEGRNDNGTQAVFRAEGMVRSLAMELVMLIRDRHPIEPTLFEFVSELGALHGIHIPNLNRDQKRSITAFYRTIQDFSMCNLPEAFGEHYDEMLYSVPHATDERPPLMSTTEIVFGKTSVSVWELYSAYKFLKSQAQAGEGGFPGRFHSGMRNSLKQMLATLANVKNVRPYDLKELLKIFELNVGEERLWRNWFPDADEALLDRMHADGIALRLHKNRDNVATAPSTADIPMWNLDTDAGEMVAACGRGRGI